MLQVEAVAVGIVTLLGMKNAIWAGTMLCVQRWPFGCCSFDLRLHNRSFTAQAAIP
jgi:hypothetical protein